MIFAGEHESYCLLLLSVSVYICDNQRQKSGINGAFDTAYLAVSRHPGGSRAYSLLLILGSSPSLVA